MTTAETEILQKHTHGVVTKVDTTRHEIEAVLTVERPDLESDIVVAAGVTFRRPLPMLRNHSPDQLLGTWDPPTPTTVGGAPAWVARGVFGRSLIAQQAFEDAADGLLLGASIAFRVQEAAPRRDAPGQRFTRIWVSEASLTPVPACDACRVVMAKSLRAPAPAPLTIDKTTLARLIRQEIVRSVDETTPIFKAHLNKALLRATGKVD